MPILSRIKTAWNAFRANEVNATTIEYSTPSASYGSYTTISPARARPRIFGERTIIGSIYARLGIDVASVDYKHVILDDMDRYKEDVDSELNRCLTLEPNIDQGPRAFRQDIAMTLFNTGAAVIVPVDTTLDNQTKEILEIHTLRVGEIIQWYPYHVKVSLYNEAIARRQEIILEKRFVAIVENPLYTVMNEPNSTLQRLIRKLSLLDAVDEQSSSGKLDLIIQLPYVIKSEARRRQAEQRREDIELQLKGSQYGIAYTDGTEKITQLNRPAENNLFKQVEYLTKLLYEQLGLTEEVMNGTADETAMRNYNNRSVEPIVDAVKEAMQRSFISSEGARKKERILYFMDPFKLVPVSEIAEITDKLARNEVLSSNEIRGLIGFKPSPDPKADKLQNSNMPQLEPSESSET